MQCLHPTYIKSPETRWLAKCLKENRPFEYYYKHAHDRRNLLLDPTPICSTPDEYYSSHHGSRIQRVPCGKCPNCLKRKVNDYFVRNYFEWRDNSAFGSSWLVTLTFADELLPRLDDGTPCFDSEVITLFLKRFRRAMDKSKLKFGDFRYFIVSEYGGEFGRPHHHGIFHFSNLPYSPNVHFKLKELIAYAWTRVDDRHAWYANVELDLFDTQRVDVVHIDSSKGIRYVCKYLGKQIGAENFDNRTDVFYRYRRNHWQSQGLGNCMYRYISPDEVRDNYVLIDGYKYALPQYYTLKLKREFYCYSEDGSIIYCPTGFARDSAHRITMQLLDEYKNLSCINPDFPKAHPSLYDPDNLHFLGDFLSKYGIMGIHDFGALDDCRSADVQFLVERVMEFFEAVDQYYKPKYAAMANKYVKQQNEYYLKKIGMR